MRRPARLMLCVAVGAVLGAALASGPLRAQSEVRLVRVSADLATDDGSAIVGVEVDLVPDDTAGVRIELLEFGRGTTEGFVAGGTNGRLIRFDGQSGSRKWIDIARDEFDSHGLRRVEVGDGRVPVWRLRASYVVTNARITKGESVLVHVPVLTVAVPPARDAGDVFHANLRVPSNWTVTETFPTGLRPDDDGVYTGNLAVAPSVVSLRARTDGRWRPGVPLILDIAALVILLAFVFTGLRWLRGARD